jgi:hypothetical protein
MYVHHTISEDRSGDISSILLSAFGDRCKERALVDARNPLAGLMQDRTKLADENSRQRFKAKGIVQQDDNGV